MASRKKEPSKRRGSAVKTGPKGKVKPKFKEGGAARPLFDPELTAEKLCIWWENGDGGNFIIEDAPGRWSDWPESKVVKEMQSRHVRIKRREGDTLNEIDQVLLHTMRARRLDESLGALSGYQAGIHEIGGQKMLVKTSPRLVTPKEGDWLNIKALIDGKLNLIESGGPDQTPYFNGWLKMAVESLYSRDPENFRPGQCCILAGPRDSGKSRLQHQLITGLLGERNADPGPYLFGRTDFNAEVFTAEHLLMEDPASSTAIKDRVFFGENLKQLLVADTQRLHRKRQDAMVVRPFFRLSISVNNDPDKMRVLPLLTPDMRDKVHLFLVSKELPLSMPAGTLAERAAFRATIKSELPAYASWLLNEFKIPAEISSTRFGVRHWLHPTLMLDLFDDTPAAELLQIIDGAQWKDGKQPKRLWGLPSKSKQPQDYWEDTAAELENLLRTSTASDEVNRLLRNHKIDRLLSRLKEDAPDRVVQFRTKFERHWMISHCPASEG